MKKLSSLLLALLLVLSVGALSAFAALYENGTQAGDAEASEVTAIEVPSEPQSVPIESVAPYYIYYQSTAPSGILSSDANSGLDPDQALATWAHLIPLVSETGGTAVIPGKGYIGANYTLPKLAQPLTITAYDEKNNVQYSGTLEVPPQESGAAYTNGTQYGMFMMLGDCTLTIEGEYIFDRIDIIERTESTEQYYEHLGTSRISVASSGKLVIKDTCRILKMTDAPESVYLNVDEGGYAYLHVLGFEKYTGWGTIVLDRALVGSGEATADTFAGFDGKVVYQDGTAAFPDDATTPDDPTESDKTVYVSDLGSDSNDGSTPETAVLTMHKAYELLGKRGGTVVIVDTHTQSVHFRAPEHTGKVTIKGLTADSVYIVAANRRYYLGGETEFTDIHVKANGNATWFLICRFNDLTITESVSVTRTGNFYIHMGGAAYSAVDGGGRDYTPSDCTLTVNGGDWGEIIGLLRAGLSTYSQEVCKSPSDFDNIDLTFNLGGNAKVNKVFAYSRQTSTSGIFSAKNATMTVNLMGGTITHFFAQHDLKQYAVGFGGGMTVNIGKDFDLAGSFEANTTIDADRLASDNVYYAFSGESAWGGNSLMTDKKLNNALLIIDESIYDEVIATGKIKTDTFAKIQSSADPITPIEPTIPEDLIWHYDSSTQTLTISGNADMMNYSSTGSNRAPWHSYSSNISRVVIEGATSIGNYAFYGCMSLESISIPDTVTSIGYAAFRDCTSLESISIPDSVTNIEEGAFSGCTNLMYNYYQNGKYLGNSQNPCVVLIDTASTDFSSFTIHPNTKVIGDDAFSSCYNLTSINIPKGVTSIGENAFDNCTSLASVSIPDSVTSIGERAFYYCTSLTSVTIGNGVTSIGNYAFYECQSLTSINIPDSVTSIGNYAFNGCQSLTSIKIPDSVTSIGKYAFLGCTSLTRVDITDIAAWCNISFADAYSNPLHYAQNLYLNGTLVTELTIPDSVTSIGNYAFYYCTSLTSINIPDSVTKIGMRAFAGCSSVESIIVDADNPVYHSAGNCIIETDGKILVAGCKNSTIPTDGSVTSIGDYAFCHCKNITSINIPNNVTSIGSYAFYSCTSLTSVTIGNGVTSIGNYAFYDCSSLTSINIPNSVTSIGERAFDNCTSLTSVSIPDSVTSIGNYAFYDCTSLTSVTIGNGVTSIGYCTFYNCQSLTSINIPEGVTSIGERAFYYCTSLTSISIPDSVTSIGDHAFYYCESLASINIPDGLTSIGERAFYNCTSLTSINIPEGVTSIGDWTFYNCTSLTSVTIGNGVTSIGSYAFYDCKNLTRVDITDIAAWCNISFADLFSNPIRYAKNLYLNDTLFTELTIPDGVTSIGNYAFYGCFSLTSINIPDSVTSIGEYAFSGCKNLATVYYCGTAEQWSGISIGSYNSALTNATRAYHKYEWAITKEPTCEDGIETGTCELCKETKNVIIPALGHRVTGSIDTVKTQNDASYPFTFSDGVYSSTNKTDSSSSTFTVTALFDCTVKLEYYVSSEENYDKLIISKNGTALYTISGKVSWTLAYIDLKDGDVLTISYSKDGSMSMFDDAGFFKIYFDRFEGDIPADKLEPTCKDAVICSYCNEIVKPTSSDHVFGDWYEVVAHTCTRVGLERRTCTVCSKQENRTVPAAHSWGDWYEITPATCTTEGVKRHDCTECDSYETGVLSTIPHSVIHHGSQAATCTSVGWYAYVTCSECDYTTYIEIPKQSHSRGEWYVKTPATCTEDGVEERICTKECGYAETRAISATGHSMGEWYVKTAPTCTEDGVEECICTNECGHAETKAISATGHSMGEWYVKTPATCTEDGVEECACTNECGHTETRAISATGHSMGEWYVKTAPTCTEEGVEEQICTNNCGHTETRAISAVGHTYSAWDILVSPEPGVDGFKSKTCSVCGDEVFEMISYSSGDVDGDGTLTNSDITLAIRTLSGWDTDANMVLADLNYDGKINNRDIIAMIQRLAGWDEE